MPTQIKCPSCSKTLTVDDARLGSKVKCPTCGYAFVTAKPEAAGGGDEITINMSLHPSQTGKEVKGETKAAPKLVQTKACPSCNAQMAANEIVCPKCSMNVMTGKKLERKAEEPEEPEKPEGTALSGKTVVLIVAGTVLLVVAVWFHLFRDTGETPTPKKQEKAETTEEDGQTPKTEKGEKGEKAGKPGESEAEKAERLKRYNEKKFRSMAEDNVKQAQSREGSRKWDEAAKLYAEAIESYGKSDQTDKVALVKKSLAAVEKVINGLKLQEAEKWDEAIATYKEAKKDLVNQAFIDSQVDFIEKFKQFSAAWKQAEATLEAGKWEEAKNAFTKASDIAETLHLKQQKLDAKDRAASVDKIRADSEALRDDMRWTFSQFEKAKDIAGVYASASYYANSKSHRLYADEAKAKMEEAKKTLSEQEKLRIDAPEKRVVLTLKDKPEEPVEGKIIEEKDGNIRFEAVVEGKPKTMLISAEKVGKREDKEVPAEVVNEERAKAIFLEIIDESQKKAWEKVVSKIGTLLDQFSDTPTVTDKARQEEIIKKVGRGVDAGTTLQAMLAAAVLQVESICPVCKGKGKVRCPYCNQEGKLLILCSNCAKNCWCPFCGAENLVPSGGIIDRYTCKQCKKQFVPLNVKCPFCGRLFLRKIALKPEKVMCPLCQKEGKEHVFLPEEKMPVNSGLIYCPTCRGRGKVGDGRTCPRCKGRKTEKCGQCAKGHVGMMWDRCPHCKPPDFLMTCEACGGRGVRKGKGDKDKL